MASLKEVRGRIKSVTSTQQITKAMKMVAAAKLRRAQEATEQMRPYAQKLTAVLNNLTTYADEDTRSVYAESREPNRVLLVAITSDRGLCGAFNSNVNRTVMRLLSDTYAAQHQRGRVRVMTVGKKVNEFLGRRDVPLQSDFRDLFQNLNFDDARHAAEHAMGMFASGEVDRVELVYNEFINVATQQVKVEQFLPIQEAELAEDAPTSNVDYLFEPSVEYILEELIPTSLKVQFYKALLESNAGEHGARMTAMDQATENAGELLRDLKLVYNRTRQAAITKEILEIVGGAEALAAD